mmetsp:Transcript_74519/g.216117  ORF Transcript_74519/g.216117 Transcript_74519/m.216117 type:complete len:240 (+) Transcript_74519:905-1624(+)
MAVITLHEVFVVAQLHCVVLVPSSPRKHTRPRTRAPAVCGDLRPALDGVQRAIHAAPVADSEDVHLASSCIGKGRPRHAFVVHGPPRRNAGNRCLSVLALGPRLLRWRAAEARAAWGLGAIARRRPTSLPAWRRAEIHPVEVPLGRIFQLHARDGHDVSEPFGGLRVVLAPLVCDPVDSILALGIRGVGQLRAMRVRGRGRRWRRRWRIPGSRRRRRRRMHPTRVPGRRDPRLPRRRRP